MYKAFGIVNSSSKHPCRGLEDYRQSDFLIPGQIPYGRLPISNPSNSGIDRIQVYVKEKTKNSGFWHGWTSL